MSPSRIRHFVRRVLAAWTGVLIILVVFTSQSIPPVVLAFLLPYLVLVAWSMLAVEGRGEEGRYPIPEDLSVPPLPDLDPELASLEVGADWSEEAGTKPVPDNEDRPSTTASVRTRRRIKPRAVPEPSPASWVQVGPGRFVRGEEPQQFSDSTVEVEPKDHAPEISPDLAEDPATLPPSRR